MADNDDNSVKPLIAGPGTSKLPDFGVKELGSGAASRLALALGHLSQGDYDASTRETASALRLDPDFFYAHVLQARTYTAQGRYDDAIGAYRAALEVLPEQSGVRLMLANVYAEVGRHDEAIAECETAIRREPAFALAHLALGNLLFERNDHARAEPAFREALRLNPQLGMARLRLAAIFAAKDDRPRAAAEAVQLLRFQPHSAMAHLTMGDRHLEAGEHEEAILEYRVASRINPTWGLAYYKLGTTFFEQRRYAEAIEEYRIALRFNAEAPGSHHQLGRAYAAMGAFEEAVIEYRAAVAAEPTRVRAWVDLGDVLTVVGSRAEGLEAYGKALELEPDSAVAAHRLAALRGSQPAAALERWRERLHAFRLTPQRQMLSRVLPALGRDAHLVGCRIHVPAGFLASERGIWCDVLAHAALSPGERETRSGLGGSQTDRWEWLLGHVVGKDAVRFFMQARRGQDIDPADIALRSEADGHTTAHGDWIDAGAPAPVVALATLEGEAVAVAADGGRAIYIGIGLVQLGERAKTAFSANADDPADAVDPISLAPEEWQLLSGLAPQDQPEWSARLRAAKASVAKALGRGARPEAHELVVRAIDQGSGDVMVTLSDAMARAFPQLSTRPLAVHTVRDGDSVVAAVVVNLLNPEGSSAS